MPDSKPDKFCWKSSTSSCYSLFYSCRSASLQPRSLLSPPLTHHTMLGALPLPYSSHPRTSVSLPPTYIPLVVDKNTNLNHFPIYHRHSTPSICFQRSWWSIMILFYIRHFFFNHHPCKYDLVIVCFCITKFLRL